MRIETKQKKKKRKEKYVKKRNEMKSTKANGCHSKKNMKNILHWRRKNTNERRKNANKGEITLNWNALFKAQKCVSQMWNNANKGEKRESRRRYICKTANSNTFLRLELSLFDYMNGHLKGLIPLVLNAYILS